MRPKRAVLRLAFDQSEAHRRTSSGEASFVRRFRTFGELRESCTSSAQLTAKLEQWRRAAILRTGCCVGRRPRRAARTPGPPAEGARAMKPEPTTASAERVQPAGPPRRAQVEVRIGAAAIRAYDIRGQVGKDIDRGGA